MVTTVIFTTIIIYYDLVGKRQDLVGRKNQCVGMNDGFVRKYNVFQSTIQDIQSKRHQAEPQIGKTKINIENLLKIN